MFPLSPAASPQDPHSSDIAVVGRSCRLPGAASVSALWDLLIGERCAVTSVPADRWPLQRHWHPRLAERGRTYTWAAGVLDDIWAFDAAAFGISPREAEQMDPQQRLLLELVWEALEDAGIRPSAFSGSDTGVFVGASSVDHANLRLVDMAAADAYMMTGNTLSVVSNRISYIFDLHGPSFTVDTACSSSLVAVNEALASLRSGRIDTAIVAGVNLLVSPQSFVGFSQAAMLSRRGLCQAFSAHADGYVRAEGGIVLVLQTTAAAARDGNTVHGVIVDAAVNSDGRTNGISLPSKAAQAKLLSHLYDASGIDPAALAFVEAHGTGTPVGDPIEAAAIGEILGRRRDAPLPIGSLKTNIGHMEAAAGLGGLLKAMLALEHDCLPASLHSAELNPAIDFASLNLEVARQSTPLQTSRERRFAGVNAFGFGGTNAHVILADASAPPVASVDIAPSYLVISAHSRGALADLAARYATHLRQSSDESAKVTIAAAATRRDRLAHRAVMPLGHGSDMASILERLDDADAASGAVRGTPVSGGSRVAFVFSGNGSQFAGMGLPAYRRNPVFRKRLDAISEAFESLAGWSIVETLHADDLSDRLHRAQVAQPLLFAIQSAVSHTLRELGLVPAMVFGHSVGEVAAAEAAGFLDERAALRTIHERSRHQELTYDIGRMAVVIGPRAAIEPILAELPGLEVAAFNSPRAHTVSGNEADLARLPDVARRHKARARMLDLAYPFHSALMSPVELPLRESLADLSFGVPHTSFISTVSGEVLGPEAMDANYWWRNVREPVRFAQAVAVAREEGAGIFIEIGPMAMLLSHVGDCLEEGGAAVATLNVLDKHDKGVDPFAMTMASTIARGGSVDEIKAFGSGLPGGAKLSLPLYPWQRKSYRLAETVESVGIARAEKWHPLVGSRAHPERLDWHCVLDTALHPWLADHCVDERVILPGAAFVEMALAVVREWCGGEQAILSDLAIASPMQITEDVGRDVLCRISPVASLIEIFSRPRLSASPWQLHVTGKIVRDTTINEAPALETDPLCEWVEGATIYAYAERAGLRYGPAFQKLCRAGRSATDRIVADFVVEPSRPHFGIDPAYLDACFHALLLAFQDQPAGTAYVPVHFGEIVLVKPGVSCTRAWIDIRRCDARAAVIDVTMANADGEIVATVRDARFRPFPSVRPTDAVDQIIRPTWVLAPEPTAMRRHPALPLDAIRAAIKQEPTYPQLRDEYVLLEGWATSLALEAACAFATDGEVRIDEVMASGKIPATLRPWLARCLTALERSGLCRVRGRAYVFDADVRLPGPDDILAALARNHQVLGVELVAASSAQAKVRAIIADEKPIQLDRLIVDFEDNATLSYAPAFALVDLLQESVSAWPQDRAMRVLQVGCGPLTRPLVALADAASVKLTVLDRDRRRLERTRLALARNDIDLVERIDELSTAAFDVVLSATPCPDGASSLRRVMSPEAILAVVEPPPSFFRDFVCGLEPSREDPSAASLSASRPDWRAAAVDLGLESIETDEIATPAGASLLLTARTPAERRHRTGTGAVVILGDAPPSSLQTSFATLLASSGLHVSIGSGVGAARLTETLRAIVVFVHAEDSETASPVLREHCMRLKRLAEGVGERAGRLWLVLVNPADGAADGIVAGLCAFSRTLSNERPMLDIRRVEVASDVRPDDLVERLHDLVLSETDETDILLDATSTHVMRFAAHALIDTCVGVPAEAARLLRSDGAGGDRLRWQAVERDAPAADEVEIAVDAAGINFRDVMFGLGLLPDDILEHGFAGPTLGLECAGRVSRVGERVANVKTGDRVMAFARHAFASHAVTPVSLVVPIPGDVESEAAATIPVAFMTAYYGLMTCARLKPREWVLIHGGAGGVGLAALQIARWRGARVIATAGSEGKRALLRSLGAEHAFDSRSGRFVEDVRRVTGEGVAVVLNSLSGEAMERSIAVLRPFGRFVELGKRDYVANTHIGLRPFRRNLSYFGVDLDQLLIDAPEASRRLLRSVVRLFERGKLVPLPYRTIEASQTTEAFRLMQQSGHVGKLVVRPPNPASISRPVPGAPLRFAADKAHLVTGGFGGFGLVTARWLTAHGARTIVLAGRSGAATEEAQAGVAELAAQGARVIETSIDVADRSGLERLFARFGRDLPPLAGVTHAAMVLDDALLADLTPERIETVLRPKVAGADHLDRLTRNLSLDYFFLYSSVTTVLGNPGQAAYVAANGYLEGLARRRRREGLPALAVAWGAIADVGVLAKAEKTRALLESRAGVRGLPARQALHALGRLLSSGPVEDAVVTIAPLSWSKARQHLPILAAPAYRLVVGREDTVATETGKIDIAELIGGTTPETAHRTVVELIVEEIARVLRLPPEDVARKTPLSEIGLDSLMAVELALGLESRFTLAAPLSTTASGFSVNELADHIIAIASGAPASDDTHARHLIGRHLNTAPADGADGAAQDADAMA